MDDIKTLRSRLRKTEILTRGNGFCGKATEATKDTDTLPASGTFRISFANELEEYSSWRDTS